MNTYHKKGIGQFLDDSISSKKIMNELNHYYQLMEETERKWLKKIIAGIKTTGHEIKFWQKEGYYSSTEQLISVREGHAYVLFHELGHYIDAQVGFQKSKTAIKIFIKEFNRKNIDIETYLVSNQNYPYKKLSGLIFDSLCIYYKINPWKYGYSGHELGYYSFDREKGAGIELFAEFFAVKFMHSNEMFFLKQEFPKTFYYLNSTINNLMK